MFRFFEDIEDYKLFDNVYAIIKEQLCAFLDENINLFLDSNRKNAKVRKLTRSNTLRLMERTNAQIDFYP